MQRSWRKSLYKALKRWYDECAIRYPEHYRRLLPKELSELTNFYKQYLTGPVICISVSNRPPARYKKAVSPPTCYGKPGIGAVIIYCA